MTTARGEARGSRGLAAWQALFGKPTRELKITIVPRASKREQKPGEWCGRCIWMRLHTSDDHRGDCGFLLQSGQQDFLNPAGSAEKDCSEWCEHFEPWHRYD